MKLGEGPPNWLSKIIEEKRRTVGGIIPFIERRDERHAIVDAIKQHPKGKPLVAKDALHDVMMAALGVANKCDRDAKKHPDVMTASAAVQASWFVFEELGLQLPEAE